MASMTERARAVLVLFAVAPLLCPGITGAQCSPPACQRVLDNGPDGQKKVVVIMGDGYATGDQTKWHNDVDSLLTNGLFANEFFRENANAFNVYRLDLVSTDSGVSQRTYDDSVTPPKVTSETIRNTALGYIWTGQWDHCWLEWGADTTTLRNNALSMVPKYDYVMVVLNQDAYGGCNRGPLDIAVPRGVTWPTLAHEAGHGIGGLMDEYTERNASFSGTLTTCPNNCSTIVDRNNVCWHRFIDSAVAIPTMGGSGIDPDRTVGEFQGCATKATNIYRPVQNCRMNSNTPPYCPVCYTIMKQKLYPALQHDFTDAVAGDFDGDGRTDVLVHNGDDLAIYRANASPYSLSPTWTGNDIIPAAPGGNTWQPAPHDQYFVGDFDGDGKADLYVFNGADWVYPYLGLLRSDGTGLQCVARYDNVIPGFWQMRSNDRLFVGDFDGDGKADLLIWNGDQWVYPYLGMLRSLGSSLAGIARFDGSVPGWQMKPGDRYYVGDFDGDGKADLYVFNGTDWSPRYLGMLRSSGSSLADVKLFTNTLPGWQMTAGDRYYVGDLDGDGKADLYVFNGTNWAYAYLLMAHSAGNDLAFVHRYDSSSVAANIPGWYMTSGDQFWIADANKDGKADLFVYNPATNWSTEYLGALQSSGSGLTGRWSADWVGGWNLGAVDRLLVARYEGGSGDADIFIRNAEWFGLLRYAPAGFVMDRIYYHWIYTALHDSEPWSDTLP